MKPTKQYIQEKALKLFNQKGFVNVRLQNIADTAFVSVGHLAYHFKNKEAIIEALYDELRENQKQLLTEYITVPLFEDINRYFLSMYRQQITHIFFYIDTLEILRAYPQIQIKHSKHIKWQLSQIKLMLSFNCSRGSFIKLTNTQLNQLAWQLRSFIDMWYYLQKIEGKNETSEQAYVADMWGMLLPFLTNMGLREFQQLNINA